MEIFWTGKRLFYIIFAGEARNEIHARFALLSWWVPCFGGTLAEPSSGPCHPRSMRQRQRLITDPSPGVFEVQRFPAGPAAEWVRSAAGIVARGGLMRDDDDKWSAVLSRSHGRGVPPPRASPISSQAVLRRKGRSHVTIVAHPQMAGRDRVVRRPPPAVVLFRRRPYGLVPGRSRGFSRLTTAGEAVTGFLAASAVAVSFVILGIVAPLGQRADPSVGAFPRPQSAHVEAYLAERANAAESDVAPDCGGIK